MKNLYLKIGLLIVVLLVGVGIVTTFTNDAKYIGEFKDGKRHGQGTLTFANGDQYVGEFRHNQYWGKGTFAYADGTIEEGIWLEGELQ